MRMVRPNTAVVVVLIIGLSTVAFAKRTCFVSLRLKTNTGFVDKDIPDFKTRAFLGSCSRVKKDCPGRVLQHVKDQFGPQVNPMRGDTARNMCKLFDREILPSQNPDVDILTKASSCGNEQYTSIGSLCCFKCKAGPYTFFHPIDNCTPTDRPAWCL